MKYLYVALCVAFFAVPFAANADIFTLYPANTITIPDCAPTGGTPVVVPKGFYQIHVSVEDAFVCYAETCAVGGMARRPGNHGITYVPTDIEVACRSAGGSAIVQFVPGGRVK